MIKLTITTDEVINLSAIKPKPCPNCEKSAQELERLRLENEYFKIQLNILFSAFNRGANGEMDRTFTEIYNFIQEQK